MSKAAIYFQGYKLQTGMVIKPGYVTLNSTHSGDQCEQSFMCLVISLSRIILQTAPPFPK